MSRLWLTSAALLVLLFTCGVALSGDLSIKRSDQLFSASLGASSPMGEVDDAYQLDTGAAFGVQYLYHLSDRVALGLEVETRRFSGSRSTRSASYSESLDDEGTVLGAGPVFRFVLQPDRRLHFYGLAASHYQSIEVSERFDFDSAALQQSGEVREEKQRFGEALGFGLEYGVSQRFLVGGELRYGQIATNFAHITLSLRVGARF